MAGWEEVVLGLAAAKVTKDLADAAVQDRKDREAREAMKPEAKGQIPLFNEFKKGGKTVYSQPVETKDGEWGDEIEKGSSSPQGGLLKFMAKVALPATAILGGVALASPLLIGAAALLTAGGVAWAIKDMREIDKKYNEKMDQIDREKEQNKDKDAKKKVGGTGNKRDDKKDPDVKKPDDQLAGNSRRTPPRNGGPS